MTEETTPLAPEFPADPASVEVSAPSGSPADSAADLAGPAASAVPDVVVPDVVVPDVVVPDVVVPDVAVSRPSYSKPSQVRSLLMWLVVIAAGAGIYYWPKSRAHYRQPITAQKLDHRHEALSAVLKVIVKEDGRVDYTKLRAEPQALIAYLRQMAGIQPHIYLQWPEGQRKAFLINLYNATVLKLVATHPPTTELGGIRDGLRFGRSIKCVEFWGQRISLDDLEKQIHAETTDSRVFHALCRGNLSGAPLRPEAYVMSRLDQQLDAQVRFNRPTDGTGPLNGL
jgi:Protein of unknown function, DUF547